MNTQKQYQIFNSILGSILILMFVYAAFFANGAGAVGCAYKQMTGIACATCGITRAFSVILHFQFQEAALQNPVSFYLFAIFFLQLLMRFSINLLLAKTKTTKPIFIYDAICSIVLFLVCFKTLIVSTIL